MAFSPIRFPKAILSASRAEFDTPETALTLTIHRGRSQEMAELPPDLAGAVFIVAPSGSIGSPPVTPGQPVVLPTQDGWTSLLNGDGLVYRLAFNQGQAQLQTRFVRSPSFYADRITHDHYPQLRFSNFGLTRLTPYLGITNQVNTAFLPMLFPGQKQRLLVTWDVGRPYEVDPKSLKVIAPVGLNSEWDEFLKMPYAVPFRQIMASAHPGFDPIQGQMFGVNAIKSLSTLLWFSRLFSYDIYKYLAQFTRNPLLLWVGQWVAKLLASLADGLAELLECIGLGGRDRLYVYRWDGSGPLQRWPVVLPNGRSVKIYQTMHQMGVTEKYIILADTAFKIVLSDLIPALNKRLLKIQKKYAAQGKPVGDSPAQASQSPASQSPASQSPDLQEEITQELHSFAEFVRNYLDFPQYPDTRLYIIDRDQLDRIPVGQSITAKPLTLKGEITHFLVDYANPQDQITIHAALNKATDPAEFLHQIDTSIFQDPSINESLTQLTGMFNNGLAVNRPSYYKVDGQTGKLETTQVLNLVDSCKFTWSLGLYAYRDDYPTQQFEDIYWSGFGAWPDMLSEFVFNLYKKYKYQDLPLQDILAVIAQGVPVTLNRLHINRAATGSEPVLTIADHYEFPKNYFSSSPQFVPRAETQGSTEGYLVCTVIHSDRLASGQDPQANGSWSDNSEIWIFDAAHLAQGPLYTLSHAELNFGFTLHSTWLSDPDTAPSRPYNVEEDFALLVEQAKTFHGSAIDDQIDPLFQQVYAEFNQDRH